MPYLSNGFANVSFDSVFNFVLHEFSGLSKGKQQPLGFSKQG